MSTHQQPQIALADLRTTFGVGQSFGRKIIQNALQDHRFDVFGVAIAANAGSGDNRFTMS